MPITFPMNTATFMSLLPIRSMTFDLPESVEVSETGGGEILTAGLGVRLWQGEIELAPMEPDEAAVVLSLLDVARGAGASFMVHDVSRPGPRNDLNGTILGAAAPTLMALQSNNREVRVTGLPVGYAIRNYDYLAFTYAANPTRFALHRAVGSVTASAGGTTGWLEVVPNIRPGALVGAAVSLLKASCKAVLVPGSVQPGRRTSRMTEGVSFKWRQTLR